MLLIGKYRFSCSVTFATTFGVMLTGVVTLANDGVGTVGIFRPTRRRVVTRQSPTTILPRWRRFQHAFNAREINRFAVIQRINPWKTTKPLESDASDRVVRYEWEPQRRNAKTGRAIFLSYLQQGKPDEKNS